MGGRLGYKLQPRGMLCALTSAAERGSVATRRARTHKPSEARLSFKKLFSLFQAFG